MPVYTERFGDGVRITIRQKPGEDIRADISKEAAEVLRDELAAAPTPPSE